MFARTAPLLILFPLICWHCSDSDYTETARPPVLPTLPDTLGEQKTIVILVKTKDMMEIVSQPEVFEEVIFNLPNGVNAFMKKASRGKTWLSGEVVGWYELEQTLGCDQEKLEKWAIEAADPEVDFTAFQRIVVLFPQTLSPCFPAGTSTIGRKTYQTQDGPVRASLCLLPWEGYISAQSMKPGFLLGGGTLCHELLHSLGVWHANSYNCGAASLAAADSCRAAEYGDPFSISGDGERATYPSALHQYALSWFGEGEVATATQSAEFHLYPLSSSLLGLSGDGKDCLALRIPLKKPIPLTDSYGERVLMPELWLEYRWPFDFDRDLWEETHSQQGIVLVRGWSLRQNQWGTAINTYLLDMHPGSGLDEFRDAALKPGEVFHEKTNDIRIAFRGWSMEEFPLIEVTLP